MLKTKLKIKYYDYYCIIIHLCLFVQLNHSDMVDGVVLININPNAEGIMDTVANKVCNKKEKYIAAILNFKG